ncbi:MAG: VOC family protein [Actinomycetota bacterium]
MPVLSLGHVRLVSPELQAWETFATDVLGFMPTPGPEVDARYFRWDAQPYRLIVREGETAGVEALAFEVVDDRDLAALAARIRDVGVDVAEGSPEEATARLVSGFVSFTDPAGTPVELFHGPIRNDRPVVTPLVSAFVTGDMGFGHAVVKVDDLDSVLDFYRDVLGFHLRNTWHAGSMSMAFLGCNPRHHTIAFGAGMPAPHPLGHFMVEAATIDDVGMAQDRCLDAKVPVRMSLGRHSNDEMISFYCQSPDAMMVEFGWGGLRVEDPEQAGTYQISKPSFWGHRPFPA